MWAMTQCLPILADIDAYLARTGMKPTTFGRSVVNDPHLVARLRNGGDITMSTAAKIEAFMSASENRGAA